MHLGDHGRIAHCKHISYCYTSEERACHPHRRKSVSAPYDVEYTPHQGMSSSRGITLNTHASCVDDSSQGTFWAVGFAEIASILANHSLSPAATKTLAATIMKIGAEKNLRLTYLSITGMLFIVGGGLIRLQCYRTLKKFFTFEVAIRENHELVTTGPYSVVRHPSYAGTLSHYIGMFFWFGTRGSWLRESGVLETTKGKVFFGLFGSMYSMVVAALLMRMSEEDKLLKKSFGKKWEEWAQRVPYCIIPGIY